MKSPIESGRGKESMASGLALAFRNCSSLFFAGSGSWCVVLSSKVLWHGVGRICMVVGWKFSQTHKIKKAKHKNPPLLRVIMAVLMSASILILQTPLFNPFCVRHLESICSVGSLLEGIFLLSVSPISSTTLSVYFHLYCPKITLTTVSHQHSLSPYSQDIPYNIKFAGPSWQVTEAAVVPE